MFLSGIIINKTRKTEKEEEEEEGYKPSFLYVQIAIL